MWDAVGEALKLFVEKHLIPTVISVVTALVSLLVAPADYWMIVKLGKSWFTILVAGVAFLAIQLLVFIARSIISARRKAVLKQEKQQKEEKRRQDSEERWLSLMDKQSPSERNLIVQLIEQENTPVIEKGGYAWHDRDSVYYDHKVIVKTESEHGGTLIKLADQAYLELSAIYARRGTISHF